MVNSELDNSVLDNSVLDNSVLDNSVLDDSVLDNSVLDNSVLDNSVLDNSVFLLIKSELHKLIDAANKLEELSKKYHINMKPNATHAMIYTQLQGIKFWINFQTEVILRDPGIPWSVVKADWNIVQDQYPTHPPRCMGGRRVNCEDIYEHI
jgi:hypothetical protein